MFHVGHKKDGIIGLVAAFSILWVLPNALKTFESNLHIVDRIIEFAKTLSYPNDVYAVASALVILGYTFRKLRSDIDK